MDKMNKINGQNISDDDLENVDGGSWFSIKKNIATSHGGAIYVNLGKQTGGNGSPGIFAGAAQGMVNEIGDKCPGCGAKLFIPKGADNLSSITCTSCGNTYYL